MEISFDKKLIEYYDLAAQDRASSQERIDAVVPDTHEDIAAIASVQTNVFIKSKDVTSRGVTVTGELFATVLYIAEGEKKSEVLGMRKSFTIEHSVSTADAGASAQVKLSAVRCEARVLNPRKVAVSAEIVSELCLYQSKLIPSFGAAESSKQLHVLREEKELKLTSFVSEKTFAISECFALPTDCTAEGDAAWGLVSFMPEEVECIGDHALFKGTVKASVCCISNEKHCPVWTHRDIPFSQLMDVNEGTAEELHFTVTPVSAYFDVMDSASGEKNIELEVRALMQVRGTRNETVGLIKDCYSNICPLQCDKLKSSIVGFAETAPVTVEASNIIELDPQCTDVVNITPHILTCTAADARVLAQTAVDVLYTDAQGSYVSERKELELQAECGELDAQTVTAELAEASFKPEGAMLASKLRVVFRGEKTESVNVSSVVSASLDEQTPTDLSEFPSVTLVKSGSGELWELAKRYHSSPELISAMNPEGACAFLLVPKES